MIEEEKRNTKKTLRFLNSICEVRAQWKKPDCGEILAYPKPYTIALVKIASKTLIKFTTSFTSVYASQEKRHFGQLTTILATPPNLLGHQKEGGYRGVYNRENTVLSCNQLKGFAYAGNPDDLEPS